MISINNFIILIFLVISFFATYSSLKFLEPIFRKYFLDRPNERSSHESPTPKAGGIVISFYSSIFSFLMGSNLIINCLPIAILGLVDDFINLSPLIRYFFQVIISIFIVSQSVSCYSTELIIFPYFIFFAFFVFLSTCFINLTNFMDGIDGLVAGCFLISFISITIINNEVNIIPIIGCLLAFLLINWYPAKLFMGDSGSTFLGALYFNSAFSSCSFEKFFAFIIINLPIFGDAIICIFRRFLAGHNIFKPHKLHLYQRLYSSGWSKSKVSSLYILMTLLLAISYYIGNFKSLITVSFLILLLGWYVDDKFSLPFNFDNLKK